MDPDGSTDHCLLAEMADDNMKVLKQNNNDAVLEVSTQKAIIIAHETTINEQKSVIEKQAAEIAKLKAANRDLKEREKCVRESFKNMKRQMPDTPTSATPPSSTTVLSHHSRLL
jgi:molecular chaperone GrpE (heat shock protein)